MMRLAQLTPAMPIPLLVAAATVPATAVPWPSTSAVSALDCTKFQPGTSFADRSGWWLYTPESITATTTEAEPVVTVQACGPAIFGRCHCETNEGSLGSEPVC